jgi:probable H4MPT-linked C1 transfer pathway protein
VNKAFFIGWDIGGAHLKAVQIDATGMVLAVSQVYCPLWRGLHELDMAMDKVLSEFNADKHFVSHFTTMTGELADIFPNRHAGVMQIAQFITQKLSGPKLSSKVMFYAGKDGFVDIGAVEAHAANIASMNWLASVQCLATNIQQALFLDIGSTTTDIALISDGKPHVLGFNDATRMQADELVYTGVVRTPLMALAQKISFAGHLVNVAAEHFATTADVYTLTGELALAENMAETADGAEKSVEASARRIARMIGWDAQDAPLTAWQNLACAFKSAQLNQIKQAMLRQISLLDDCSSLHVIGAGAGDFLALELAQQLGFKYESIANLIIANNDEVKKMAAVCFPAYAVAYLGSVMELQC